MRFFTPKKALEKLRIENKEHHQSIADLTEHRGRFIRALEAREKHFNRLQSMPFFKRLLHHPLPFEIEIKGKRQRFRMLSQGIERKGASHGRSVFILDNFGRLRLFFKSTPSKNNPNVWREFRSTIQTGHPKAPIWEYKERPPRSTPEYEELEVINKAINDMESKITFNTDWDPEKIKLAMKYL